MFPGLWCFHVYVGVIQANFSKLPLESELNADEATLCINRLLKGFSGARRRLREVSWWANQLRNQSSNRTLHSKSSWKETQLLAPPVCLGDPCPGPCCFLSMPLALLAAAHLGEVLLARVLLPHPEPAEAATKLSTGPQHAHPPQTRSAIDAISASSPHDAMEQIRSLHFEMVPAAPCHLLASENSLHLTQVEKRSCSDLTEKNTWPTCWTDCAQGGHCWSATAAEGHRLPEALLSYKAPRCCLSSKSSLFAKR